MILYDVDTYTSPHELISMRGSFLEFYDFLAERFGDDTGGISVHLEFLKGLSPKKRLAWLKDEKNFDIVLDTLDWYEADLWLDYILRIQPVKPWEEYEVTVNDDGVIQVREYKLYFMPNESDKVAEVIAYLIKKYKVSSEDITAALL